MDLMLLEAGSTAVSSYIDVTGVDFMIVLNEMVALLPSMLPVAIAGAAFRKGISFVLGFIHGI